MLLHRDRASNVATLVYVYLVHAFGKPINVRDESTTLQSRVRLATMLVVTKYTDLND